MATQGRGTDTHLEAHRGGSFESASPRDIAASRDRQPADGEEPGDQGPLAEQLWQNGYQFEFFQAVALLARLYPQRKPVGYDFPPKEEVVRFRAHPALHFPASEIYEVDPPAEPGQPPEMEVTFFGLYGPSGVLPQHYTQLIIDRGHRKDHTLRDFLDLFNHRLLSLFFRAWEKYRFWIPGERTLRREQRERPHPQRYRKFVLEERPQSDLFSQILLDLGGLGTPGLRYRTRRREQLDPRTSLHDQTFRFYAGLLSQRRTSAVGLEGMLQDYFGWQTRVIQFCGQWLRLDPQDRSQLVPKGNTQLGVSMVAGERIWDVQSKFRVRVGPVGFEAFCQMLPIGSAYRPLVDLVRLYAGMEFDFDVELLLRTVDIPDCQLGAADGLGARLGWTTWVCSRELEKSVASVVLSVHDG